MLKFKEGKLMVVNLLVQIAISSLGMLLSSHYGENMFYSVSCILLFLSAAVLAVLQIILSIKMYGIAKEMSKVDSSTDMEDNKN